MGAPCFLDWEIGSIDPISVAWNNNVKCRWCAPIGGAFPSLMGPERQLLRGRLRLAGGGGG